jgi:type I protein arginine methyltransferase
LRGLGHRVRATKRLRDWFYPPVAVRHPDADYREFNADYFGLFDQQERMLADGPRMAFYHALIARHVQPGDRVIDLGTGTGVLAAWAAQAGADRVYALDHSTILETAKTVAAFNGVERVEFVAGHSEIFTLEDKVDVIVHEQMGDYLFDEDMVANVCDLRDRLLRPGGRIVPSQFEWYCEPVTVRANRRVPFIWEIKVPGYDYGCLRSQRPDEPEYFRQASSDLALVEAFLGEPYPAIEIDLHTLDATEGLPREVTIRRPVVRAGRLDGLAVYFQVTGGGDLKLSSSPLDAARAPHWGYRILRTDTEELAVGDVVTAKLRVDRWAEVNTWDWAVTVRRVADDLAVQARPLEAAR